MIASIKQFISRHGVSYAVFLAATALAFIAVKFTVPILFNGSYLDEYWHLVSGMTLFEEGYLPRFYGYQVEYDRGSFVTWTAGLFVWLFGKSIFVGKLVPLLLGVVDFVLVAYLSHRIINQKKYRILLLLVYTINPWVLFNHFYLRMYVFYELFLLINLILSERLLAAVVGNWGRRALVILLWLCGFNAFYFFFGHDQGIYMPLIGVLVALCYIFVFETTHLSIPNSGPFYRILNRIFRMHAAWKLVGLFALGTAAFFALDLSNKIDFLLHADLRWTSAKDLKYSYFFFTLHLPFTVFFGLSAISVFSLKKPFQRLLALVGATLFAVHFLSSPDLQIVRGILYFLPVFFLIAFISLSEMRYLNNWVPFGLFGLIFVYSTVVSYPTIYFQGPNVPSEVHYIDYARAYKAVKEHCSDSTFVEATPSSFIADFYDVKVDYVISSTGWIKRDEMFYFDKQTNRYRTAYNNVPVLEKFSQLEQLGGDVCLLVRYPSDRRFVANQVLQSLRRTARPLEFRNLTLFRIAEENI